MIELRNYEHMHVYRVSRAQSSKRTRIYGSEQGGRVYEIKTLRSNLAPKKGGAFIRGGCIIEQVRYKRGPNRRPRSSLPCAPA